jgi:hypothetical protein
MKPLQTMNMNSKIKGRVVKQSLLGDGYLWEVGAKWRE